MYSIRLVYTRSKGQQDFLVMDNHTFCACTQLELRGIHTVQCDYCTIQFESARDRSYALLALSDSPLYTVQVLDDES
jgi:hypothetical protein